jgi:hypothetical protein
MNRKILSRFFILWNAFQKYSLFIHSRNTRNLKLDSRTVSFEETLVRDIWTQYITSPSTCNDFIVCKLMLKILMF